LEGRLLGEVTCGYGLVAIVFQRRPSEPVEFFPPEDVRLEAGNRLIVLATIGGLQNAEHGVSAERTHQVRILKIFSEEAGFEGARAISRVTGCNLGAASALLAKLPATLPQILYRQQARRLARELGVIGVNAEVVPAQTSPAGLPTGD
jgi:hypothetical protein